MGVADEGGPQALRQGRENGVGLLEMPGLDVEDAEFLLDQLGVRAVAAEILKNPESLIVVALFEPRFREQQVQPEIAGHALDRLLQQLAGFAGFPVEHEPRRRVHEGLRPVFHREEQPGGLKDAFPVVVADGLVEQERRVGMLRLGGKFPQGRFLRRAAGAPREHLHGQRGADHPAQQVADKTRAGAGAPRADGRRRSRERGRGLEEANAETHG